MNEAARIHLRDAGRSSTRSGAIQRWGALIGGGALAIYGLARRSPWGLATAAAGGALAYTGAKSDRMQREAVARSSVIVNCAPEEAYRFWRDFENLPRFMHHLDSVTVSSERRSKWIVLGPMGARIQWDAEIVTERENQFIAWRSLPGSDLEIEGSVEFRKAPGNRGTLVMATVRYRPPAGAVGKALTKLLGKDPSFLMEQDLRRFRALLEAGEIPTVEGQPHGPRDLLTAAARVADPDRPIRREAGIVEALHAKRRVS